MATTRKTKAAALDDAPVVDTVTRDLPFDPAPAGNEPAPQHALATLPPAQRALIVLNSTKAEQDLKALVAKSSGIITVVDANGREEAHRAGMSLKNARVAIKNTGKAARDDANAFCTAVIAEEKRLVALIETEEERVFKLRDDFDAKVKAEKEEAERKERERVDGIKAKIAAISAKLDEARGKDAAALRALCMELAQNPPTEADFAEFFDQANAAYSDTGKQLAALYRDAKDREEEAARLAAEKEAQRVEAERLAAEQARLQAERDEQQRATAAVARLTELRKTEGAAAQIGAALEEAKATDDFAEPFDALVQMARDMTIAALEPRLAAAVEEELAAQQKAEVQPEPAPLQALAEAETDLTPEPAPAPQAFEPIDWDAPPPLFNQEYVGTTSAPEALPESWSAADEAVTDADIIETVSAHYGWNYVDAVERIRTINFDAARQAA